MNIVRAEVEENVRRALMRHKGVVPLAAKELGIDAKFVERIWRRMKGKIDRDVAYYIAFHLLTDILYGRMQRVQILQDQVTNYSGFQSEFVSECCRVHVFSEAKPTNFASVPGASKQPDAAVESILKCSGCKKTCAVLLRPNDSANKEMREVLKELRLEDESISNFVDKLYGGDKPAPVRVQQNVLVVKDSRKQINSKEVDSGIISEFELLEPRERQKIRRTLEKKLKELTDGKSDDDADDEGSEAK